MRMNEWKWQWMIRNKTKWEQMTRIRTTTNENDNELQMNDNEGEQMTTNTNDNKWEWKQIRIVMKEKEHEWEWQRMRLKKAQTRTTVNLLVHLLNIASRAGDSQFAYRHTCMKYSRNCRFRLALAELSSYAILSGIHATFAYSLIRASLRESNVWLDQIPWIPSWRGRGRGSWKASISPGWATPRTLC